jgi:signal transduction histidine kinase/putative heme iron utilization protein
MKYFSFLLFLFVSSNCQSQVNTDSLRDIVNGNGSYKDRINASIKFAQFYVLRDFDSTVESTNEGLRLARKNSDSVSVAELKSAIGQAHYFRGNYDIAAANYYESITILEKIALHERGAKLRLANAYNDLAKLYRKIRDLDRALANYDKAEAIFNSLNDAGGMAMILNESGVVFEYRGDYTEAIRRYSASKDIAEKTNNPLSISYSLSNIAGVNVIQKKYDEAEKNLLLALDIRKNLGDSFAIALTYSDLGATMNAKGNYAKAINYLAESNRMAEKIHYAELQSNNYNELSSASASLSDYKQALAYFQKRTGLHDSIFSMEKTKQIEELDARYQTVKKEQIIEQQQNRIIQQNFIFLGLAGLTIMICLLAWSQYKRYGLIKEKQLQAEIMKQQELATRAVIEAEEEERQRIARDLHDGVGQMMSAARMNLSAFETGITFNNENQKKSFDKIVTLVDDSCREVRHVSHNMMSNALMKNSFARAITDFIDKLDKQSLEVHIYTQGLEERFDSNTETVLYRIMQECVNNVIKHAQATTLDIAVIRDKDGISATIEDNGKGFDTSDKSKFEGIGIKNILTRVEFLKGIVEFDAAPGRGTAISLHVPLSASAVK